MISSWKNFLLGFVAFKCSKACGGGERTKKVVCIKANEVVDVSHCDADSIIFSHEDCNEQACTEGIQFSFTLHN